jgi:hypothetical protein
LIFCIFQAKRSAIQLVGFADLPVKTEASMLLVVFAEKFAFHLLLIYFSWVLPIFERPFLVPIPFVILQNLDCPKPQIWHH